MKRSIRPRTTQEYNVAMVNFMRLKYFRTANLPKHSKKWWFFFGKTLEILSWTSFVAQVTEEIDGQHIRISQRNLAKFTWRIKMSQLKFISTFELLIWFLYVHFHPFSMETTTTYEIRITNTLSYIFSGWDGFDLDLSKYFRIRFHSYKFNFTHWLWTLNSCMNKKWRT